MEVIKEVGAFAGLAAFLGLAVLALLYFAQARDVRRLRENAEFLVEGDPMPTHPEDVEAAAEGAEAAEGGKPPPKQPKAAARAAAASAPNDAEAFRRAELARQAAERRQRFETRRREDGDDRRLPSTAVMIVGALILLAGIGFGASRLLGGDDASTGDTQKNNGQALACPPGQTKVAVLNSTPEAGLAAGFAKDLTTEGYDVGPVSNTESPFDASTVMYAEGSQDCAPEVAPVVDIEGSEPMDQEVRTISEGAQVAVVLGEDKAPGSSASTDSADGSTTDASSSETRWATDLADSATPPCLPRSAWRRWSPGRCARWRLPRACARRGRSPARSDSRPRTGATASASACRATTSSTSRSSRADRETSSRSSPRQSRSAAGRPTAMGTARRDDVNAHCFDWDATDEAGGAVGAGIYRLRVTLNEADRSGVSGERIRIGPPTEPQ